MITIESYSGVFPATCLLCLLPNPYTDHLYIESSYSINIGRLFQLASVAT